jgi:hypothetical protein
LTGDKKYSDRRIPLNSDSYVQFLGWHGARLSFLALFLIALLRVKTVNLAELATGFRGHAKTESNYKRLQRFFRHFDLDYQAIAKIMVALMNIPQPWILSTDRTECDAKDAICGAVSFRT